jgi:hypothetical protein
MNDESDLLRLLPHAQVIESDSVDGVVTASLRGGPYPATLAMDTNSSQLMLRVGPIVDFAQLDSRAATVNATALLDATSMLREGRFAGYPQTYFELLERLTHDDETDRATVARMLTYLDSGLGNDFIG